MPNVIAHSGAVAAAPADYRGGDGTPLTGDTDDWTNPLDTAGADKSIQPTKGNDTLAVSARLSVASATVDVICGLWYVDVAGTRTFLGIAGVLTATASSDQVDADSRYVATTMLAFPLDGATHYELRVNAPSSGNVALVPVLVGPDPQAGPSDTE